MRDTDDDQRTDDQQNSEPADAGTRAKTAAVARMLANPRRVRRS